MLEQVGNALVMDCPFDRLAALTFKTGLTDVTVDVYNPAGTQIVTDGAATEIGTSGVYTYTLSAGSVTTEGRYLGIFKTASNDVVRQHKATAWWVGTRVKLGNVSHGGADAQVILKYAQVYNPSDIAIVIASNGGAGPAVTVSATGANTQPAIRFKSVANYGMEFVFGAGLGPFTEAVPEQIAEGVLDLADGIEADETLRQTLRLLRAMVGGLVGVSTVGDTTTVTFKRKDGTTTAATVEHDEEGNRSSVTVGDLS